jgi:hypothetical protein
MASRIAFFQEGFGAVCEVDFVFTNREVILFVEVFRCLQAFIKSAKEWQVTIARIFRRRLSGDKESFFRWPSSNNENA